MVKSLISLLLIFIMVLSLPAGTEAVTREQPSVTKTLALWLEYIDTTGGPLGTEEGIGDFIRRAAAAGYSKIYWAVWVIGSFAYWTKIERIFAGIPKLSYTNVWAETLKKFDPLQVAVKYGHQYGVEIHASVEMYDEGWYPVGYLGAPGLGYTYLPKDDPETPENETWSLYTRFAREHPEFLWLSRDGKRSPRCLSLAFPEVRAYRISLCKELLSYGIDGLHLDFVRVPVNPDQPSLDTNGVCFFGYEEPLVEGYEQKYGVDPHNISNDDPTWVQYRANNTNTLFLRELKEEILELERGVEVTAWVLNGPEWSRKAALQDWRTWGREGLVDAVIPFLTDGWVGGVNPAKDPEFEPTIPAIYDWTLRAKEAVQGGCRVLAGLSITSELSPKINTVNLWEEAAMNAFEAGANGIQVNALGVWPSFIGSGESIEKATRPIVTLATPETLLETLKEKIDKAKGTGSILLGPEARAYLNSAEKGYRIAQELLNSGGDPWPPAIKALRNISRVLQAEKKAIILTGVATVAVVGIFLVLYMQKHRKRQPILDTPSRNFER